MPVEIIKGDMVSKPRLIQGVGTNDANYTVKISEDLPRLPNGKRRRKVVWRCPYYSRWESMLSRVYSKNYHLRRPTYKGCSVCEEWLLFSNFKKWVDEQPCGDWENRHLDKDLLIKK